jgi:ubiquinone/menaquinone biosynthesis C-methylase UbiE
MDDLARLERERLFHNDRFEEGGRQAQDKYYWALTDCDEAFYQLVERQAAGAHVLEYGCAMGDWSLQLAPSVARIDGIDISDVAIRKAQDSAASLGLDNVFFHAMDAQATSFEDDTFDLVFGSGIIHHLDTRRCLEEIRRILKPGGLAIFKEPLGQNAIINVYRALTPFARTVDEHPLLPVDLQIARSLFKEVDWEFYGLFTFASVPFGVHKIGRAIYRVAAKLDQIAAKMPGVRWQLWYALISMRK